jgi:hypothetical protein
MLKKALVVLMAFSLSAAVFALGQDVETSAGIGFSASSYYYTEKAAKGSDSSKKTEKTLLWGGCAFFDATYAQLSLGFGMSDVNASYKVADDLGIMGGSIDATYNDYPTMTYLSFGILFKYPVDMTGFYLFPLLGLEYDLNLGYKDADGNDLKADMSADEKANLNMVWIKAGIGLDIPIARKIYLRPEVLAAYKFRSKLNTDAVDAYEASGASDVSVTTIKVDIGLLLGYQFK